VLSFFTLSRLAHLDTLETSVFFSTYKCSPTWTTHPIEDSLCIPRVFREDDRTIATLWYRYVALDTYVALYDSPLTSRTVLRVTTTTQCIYGQSAPLAVQTNNHQLAATALDHFASADLLSTCLLAIHTAVSEISNEPKSIFLLLGTYDLLLPRASESGTSVSLGSLPLPAFKLNALRVCYQNVQTLETETLNLVLSR
jgi:hypothetical protein